jgi:protein phosphatase
MGTTVAAVAVVEEGSLQSVAVVHVGDSRAYLLHDGELRRTTEDHSVVADRVQAGELTEEEARTDPQRSILTRALGIGPFVEVDLAQVRCAPGDLILLCTDGLFTEVDDAGIFSVLTSGAGPASAAQRLVRLAVDAGGRDNASVVVVAVT